jgi:hypothetical protein
MENAFSVFLIFQEKVSFTFSVKFYVELYVAEFSRLFSIILNEENGKRSVYNRRSL